MYSRPHVKYQHVCSMCTHVSCYILSTQGQYMDGKVHKMQNVLSEVVEQSLLNSDWICQNVKDHSSNLTMQCEMDQVSINNLSLIFCFLDLKTDLKCHWLSGTACTLGTINLQQPLEDFHSENVLPPFFQCFRHRHLFVCWFAGRWPVRRVGAGALQTACNSCREPDSLWAYNLWAYHL